MPGYFTGNNLVCIRGGRTVFSNLSFAIGKGDALVLRGHNGCGKSTLLRIMAGLLQPELGQLTWNNQDIYNDIKLHQSNLHYIGNKDALKPLLSVIENLSFTSSLREAGSNFRKALNFFELNSLSNLPVRFLSAGQRQRLALTRLIANPAPLWLLDEPTTSLDDAGLAILQSIISAHCATGGMVVLADHGSLDLNNSCNFDVSSFGPADESAFATVLK